MLVPAGVPYGDCQWEKVCRSVWKDGGGLHLVSCWGQSWLVGLLWPGRRTERTGVGRTEDDFGAGGSAIDSYVGLGNSSIVGGDGLTCQNL